MKTTKAPKAKPAKATSKKTSKATADRELREWAEKRPKGHPERTSWVEFEIPKGELRKWMETANRLGIDNFEDFLCHIMHKHFDELRFAKTLGAEIGDRVAEKLQQKGAAQP